MREIKFRGWDGKEMLEHWDILGNHSDYFLDESGVLMERSWTPSGQGTPTSTNIILMQYTGLKDSKGVEIYELCEINNSFIVTWLFNRYVLTNISSGDIVEFKEGGSYEVTKEFVAEYPKI